MSLKSQDMDRFGRSAMSEASRSTSSIDNFVGHAGCCGIKVVGPPIWILVRICFQPSLVSSLFNAGPMYPLRSAP